MKHKFLGLFILLSLLTLGAKANTQQLVFSAFEEEMAITESILPVMTEAYRRIGKTIEIVRYPGERAIRTANSGEVDGELFRKKEGIEQAYPNLIKIPICIYRSEFVAFTKHKTFPVKGWDSLRPYTVGYLRGLKVVEMNLAKGTHSVAVESTAQAFQMLEKGRNDVVVTSRQEGLSTIEELGLKNIHVMETPLLISEAYHYLHVKNQNLLSPLTDALQQMQREGLIQGPCGQVE